MPNSSTPSKPSSFKLTKLSEIRENPNNPRTIKEDKFEKLVRSIQDFPEMLEARPIVVNPDGVIIGGNMRYKACKAAGLTEAPVYVASWEEAKANAFIIKDNVGYGEWDWDILANEWDAAELEEWGLDVWQPDEEPTEGFTDPDDVPEAPEEPKTKLGDLYILGEHRLLCGDSTKAEDVERLMDGNKADITFTSPPYNQAKNSHLSGRIEGFDSKYQNSSDALTDEEYFDLIYFATLHAVDVSRYAFINLQLLAHNKHVVCKYQHALVHWLKDVLIWNKKTAPPNIVKGAFNTKFEFVFVFSHDNETRGFPCSWQGQHPNVIETENNSSNAYAQNHRAGFPIAFPQWFMDRLDFVKSIYDPFMGTGTTFIVAEQNGKTCYGMELDPKYCDVIVKRWEDFTGKKAELWKP